MKIRATQVFTPSSIAHRSFVERSQKVNSQLVDALRTPGKQIVVYGYSGCGKSTLLQNKLNQVYENAIITRCMKGMSIENILADGFDQLEQIISDEEKKKRFSISPKVAFEYETIKASFSLFDYSSQSKTSTTQLLPPQLTARRLGKFFGESNSCWVLEDFHKIEGEDKTKVSQIMKIFMDMAQTYPTLKIIAIGAVGTARQVVEYDHEMNNRLTEILVPPMEPDEIESIISIGKDLLNIQFTRSQKDKIVEYSCGIPALCHQICLNMCFKKGVSETLDKRRTFDDEDLDEAIERLVSEKSDSLKADYELSISESVEVIASEVKSILKAAMRINKAEFSLEQIKSKLSEPIEKEKILIALEEMSSVKRGEVFIFNEASGMYRFNNLFIKSYILMNLSSKENTKDLVLLKDRGSVNRLLDIIHQDFSDEYEEIILE